MYQASDHYEKTLSAAIAIIIVALLLTGALYASFVNQPDYSKQIKSMMDKKWAEYTTDNNVFNGSLSMRIISPKGDFFVTTSQDGLDGNVHFRGASTTKTFTAAAIMLLYQEGKL